VPTLSNAIHGKGAVLYLGANGAAAINVAEQLDCSLDFDMALVDVTPLNFTWKDFVKGMQGYTGAFNGNFDTTSNQIYLASTSSVAEKFYLYPQASVPTQYYYGTAWVQLGKIAAGSTTTKASNGFKITGRGPLSTGV
jgi:hypothetical protein